MAVENVKMWKCEMHRAARYEAADCLFRIDDRGLERRLRVNRLNYLEMPVQAADWQLSHPCPATLGPFSQKRGSVGRAEHRHIYSEYSEHSGIHRSL